MTAETLLPAVLGSSAASAREAVSQAVDLTPQDMADMVTLLATEVRLLEDNWDRLRARMDAGMERSRLRADAVALGDAAGSLLGLGRVLSRFTPEGKPAAMAPARRAELEGLLARLDAASATIAALIEWLDKPWPPIDQERLARGIAEAERGEGESTDAILERLRIGGEP
jgi:hypothetical protein